MNRAVVIFVDHIKKVNKVTETGIVVNDTFLSVYPLTTPAKQVTISNNVQFFLAMMCCQGNCQGMGRYFPRSESCWPIVNDRC